MKGKGLGRNKRRTARAMKHSALPPKAVRQAMPTTRDRDQCPYCGREGGPIDPACNPQKPCTPSTT